MTEGETQRPEETSHRKAGTLLRPAVHIDTSVPEADYKRPDQSFDKVQRCQMSSCPQAIPHIAVNPIPLQRQEGGVRRL